MTDTPSDDAAPDSPFGAGMPDDAAPESPFGAGMPDDAAPDSPFGAGMPDLGGLLESAQQMMAQAQAAANEVVEGVSGGGLVKIEVDGHFDFKKVTIDRAAIDPDEPDVLEDLVLAALRDAVGRLQDGQQDALGIDLGALGLGEGGGLGGLLGGGDQ